ncbi:hypothetical protein [Geomonas azotofigens]|uniref:hypothetical protein n=1 Tax=Geomonas azotofigens TaxID=2843196 RepID=UPI001C11D71E|nr:hypothetical protein [Geomonas azotofigens]MBU5614069.1 hypothetical protein [Geomonas azotofigens]
MDDDTFKNEVLNRLQQIMEMLTSILPEACVEELDEARDPVATPKVAQASDAYGIHDEMQDDYRTAMEKWNLEHRRA